MLTESHDEEQIIARVAALDIGKTEVVCCVRVPAGANAKKRLQEVSTHSTMTRALTELANHLVDLGVERVVMEATSDYWQPVFYLLEAHGLDPWRLEVLAAHGFDRRFAFPHGGHLTNLHIAAGLGLGGCESYPGVFAPFGGYPDGCVLSAGRIAPTDTPGFGLEQKAGLAELITDLTA